MEQTITITPKWQIHIPLKIREELGLTKPMTAKIRVEREKMVITPVKSSLLAFAGKFKDQIQKKKIDLDKIRDKIDYSQL
ncbi:hypothetical protein A2160_04735 [Candidatus Beckwithbacteria bacterium RBG_13_42_9]|uniref:SpoVT-AbrB domain-containing protein n=1 Tax=Candidatus Beckwithbacteria bacterium RBG_13_42_9 TaxID=1797457 RepID=A0A1F5E5U5_9BACT|nr:MAG: hypothetical protein A2160_04735 [Candidatus Beckwithbacteria bacterium RBG_13_42_9]